MISASLCTAGFINGDMSCPTLRTHRHSFARLLQPRPPVARSAAKVRHRHDYNPRRFDSIDNAERKAVKQATACSVVARWPCFWKTNDCRFGRVDLVTECGCSGHAAFSIPARRSFCLFESFLEIFKLAGHGRLLRGCDDVPPTMKSSWRFLRRGVRAAPESPQTTLLPRPDRRRDRGSESARRPAPLALQRIGGVPLPRAAWHP